MVALESGRRRRRGGWIWHKVFLNSLAFHQKIWLGTRRWPVREDDSGAPGNEDQGLR